MALLAEILTLSLNDNGKLLASVAPSDDKPPLDNDTLTTLLAQQGYSHLYFYDGAFAALISQYATANDGFDIELGERRDGQCLITLDSDKMNASLTLDPPFGGTPVTLAMLQQLLREKNVTRGIAQTIIDAALAQGHAADLVIATGQAAVNGIDTRFQSLIAETGARKPQEDKHGTVDYRDLGEMVMVKQGDPLMRRIPPTAGTPGYDITGQVLAPKPGQDIAFASGLKNAEPDPNDSNLLRATLTGLPKVQPQGVMVDPTMNVNSVDLSTGNMRFEGAIVIKGDVKDGMKVAATGDIHVGGTVESAELRAGGDIVIKGGVIGLAQLTSNPSEDAIQHAKLISKGNISLRFAENVYMEAEGDILIEQYSMNNHLLSLGSILVGKAGDKKARIIGGLSSATTAIKTGKLGSEAGYKTKVRAGFNPKLQAQLVKLQREMDAKQKELDDIMKIITFVMAHPEKNHNDLLQRALNTKEKLDFDRARQHSDKAALVAQLALSDDVQIVVEHTLYPGVDVQIGHPVLHNTLERSKGVFRLQEGEIVYGS